MLLWSDVPRVRRALLEDAEGAFLLRNEGGMSRL